MVIFLSLECELEHSGSHRPRWFHGSGGKQTCVWRKCLILFHNVDNAIPRSILQLAPSRPPLRAVLHISNEFSAFADRSPLWVGLSLGVPDDEVRHLLDEIRQTLLLAALRFAPPRGEPEPGAAPDAAGGSMQIICALSPSASCGNPGGQQHIGRGAGPQSLPAHRLRLVAQPYL